jgi:hypothetical protein
MVDCWIRNPIYTSTLGMLIATGLAMEHRLATIAEKSRKGREAKLPL